MKLVPLVLCVVSALVGCGERGAGTVPGSEGHRGSQGTQKRRWSPGEPDASGKPRPERIVAAIQDARGQETLIRKLSQVLAGLGIPHTSSVNMGSWHLIVDAEHAEEAKAALRGVPELSDFVTNDRPPPSR